jgi:hypothetical protein
MSLPCTNRSKDEPSCPAIPTEPAENREDSGIRGEGEEEEEEEEQQQEKE